MDSCSVLYWCAALLGVGFVHADKSKKHAHANRRHTIRAQMQTPPQRRFLSASLFLWCECVSVCLGPHTQPQINCIKPGASGRKPPLSPWPLQWHCVALLSQWFRFQTNVVETSIKQSPRHNDSIINVRLHYGCYTAGCCCCRCRCFVAQVYGRT